MLAHVCDSSTQRGAEEVIRTHLAENILGIPLHPMRFRVHPWPRRVFIDAASLNPPVLCEIYAHQGALKGGQFGKITQDALKLIHVRKLHALEARLIITLACHYAYDSLFRNWQGRALRQQGIQVFVADIPSTLSEKLKKAQKRQGRIHRGIARTLTAKFYR